MKPPRGSTRTVRKRVKMFGWFDGGELRIVTLHDPFSGRGGDDVRPVTVTYEIKPKAKRK